MMTDEMELKKEEDLIAFNNDVAEQKTFLSNLTIPDTDDVKKYLEM
jgi:hypothetical protein